MNLERGGPISLTEAVQGSSRLWAGRRKSSRQIPCIPPDPSIVVSIARQSDSPNVNAPCSLGGSWARH